MQGFLDGLSSKNRGQNSQKPELAPNIFTLGGVLVQLVSRKSKLYLGNFKPASHLIIKSWSQTTPQGEAWWGNTGHLHMNVGIWPFSLAAFVSANMNPFSCTNASGQQAPPNMSLSLVLFARELQNHLLNNNFVYALSGLLAVQEKQSEAVTQLSRTSGPPLWFSSLC